MSYWKIARTVDAKAKSSKTAFKKGGVGGIGGRKALKDITNKSSVKSEISSRKNVKIPPKEEFNIADEGFLHDHKKCIEEQEAALNHFDLNLVLPGHGNGIGFLPSLQFDWLTSSLRQWLAS